MARAVEVSCSERALGVKGSAETRRVRRALNSWVGVPVHSERYSRKSWIASTRGLKAKAQLICSGVRPRAEWAARVQWCTSMKREMLMNSVVARLESAWLTAVQRLSRIEGGACVELWAGFRASRGTGMAFVVKAGCGAGAVVRRG